jgi:hypothetical protein
LADDATALAVCFVEINCIAFSPAVLDWNQLPLDTLMAHELAHACHAAKGTTEKGDKEELQANTTISRWGYDASVIRDYESKLKLVLIANSEQTRTIVSALNFQYEKQ